MHILIVEDIRFSSLVLEHYLKARQYSFATATTAFQALDILQQDQPVDLVIADLFLSDMDGIQLFSESQKLKRYRRQPLPFVLLTASTNPDDFRRAEAAGFTAALGKPFDPKALGEILGAIDEGQVYLQKDPERSKILVLDAKGKNNELLQEVFNNTGYRLLLMTSGMDGLNALNEYTGIKAVITDLELPDMNANEFMQMQQLRGLTHREANRPLYMLLAESSTDVELVQQAYLSGYDEVVFQPVDKFMLKHKVNKLFQAGVKNAGKSSHILVVDDVRFQCLLMTQLLTKAGLDSGQYSIDSVLSGYDALDYLVANPKTGLVFTDLMLGDMTGVQLYKAAQERFSRSPAPVKLPAFALMSVSDDAYAISQALESGFCHAFKKPVQPMDLKMFLQQQLPDAVFDAHFNQG